MVILRNDYHPKTNCKENFESRFLITSEIIAIIFQPTFCELNVAMDLKSSREILCLQNDCPLFLIQISCFKANFEFNFFRICQNMDLKACE